MDFMPLRYSRLVVHYYVIKPTNAKDLVITGLLEHFQMPVKRRDAEDEKKM